MRRMMYLSTMIGLCLIGTCSPAQSQEVQVIDYGIYTGKGDAVQEDPDSPTGQMRVKTTELNVLLKKTDVVPTVLKTTFGFKFKVIGLPEGATTKLRLQYTFPEMTNPTNGKVSSSYEVSGDFPVAPLIAGMTWDFVHPWEMRPGKWTMRIYSGKRLLTEKVFTVVGNNKTGSDIHGSGTIEGKRPRPAQSATK